MGSNRYHGWEDELAELDVDGLDVFDKTTGMFPPTVEQIMRACEGKPYFVRISEERARALKYENDRCESPRSADRIASDLWFEMEQSAWGSDSFDNERDYDPDDVPDALEY
jgi:hypothetical protein